MVKLYLLYVGNIMSYKLYYWNSGWLENKSINYLALANADGSERWYCLTRNGRLVPFTCWDYYEL